MITNLDIVTTQILIAQGKDLHKEIGIPEQKDIRFEGVVDPMSRDDRRSSE